MEWGENDFSHDLIYDGITVGLLKVCFRFTDLKMAIVKIQKVFMKKLVVLFAFLHFGVSGDPHDGSNIKSETKLANNSSIQIASQLNDSSARGYHFISNRDSYVNAANSFASGEMSFPQNSYAAPMQGGYSSSGYGGGMQQQVGYGWTDLGN